ncbi:exopolyphosphatase [Rhodoplanes elegans]|uniref:exopolyphosphatase n=1 Tax=Rhodoplanes elegans TaxID=29408 RepID=A0A327KNT4_9BRAD|nr:exopolyphosphatase [Rhodoplanes elegans]MBK5960662.1 exopolyphosphatase [Rhodoplanes elegans]RAI39654.1 exopolyphosphatase [Rhodoplanes elegans]
MLKRTKTAPAVPPGRLDVGPPVAVIDIGSNSIRLVAYEGLCRSPTPIFNEKVLAGLGREVLTTGLLAPDAVARALAALQRFRMLCDVMGVERLWVIATAACREAKNGPQFIREAKAICGVEIDVLSGKREATLSALGVVSGIHRPDGIVGDLGGGSLELVDVKGTRLAGGASLPLGGLALQDLSARSLKKADKIVDEALRAVKFLKAGQGRAFYAVGGTWRALTRLHMRQTGYPLHVMQNYVIPAREALEFARLVRRVNADTLSQIESVNEFRRPLLGYAAVVLEHIIRAAKPREIVVSAAGVREGLLFSALPERERKRDPLIAAAMELNVLRSRSPEHGLELIDWTDRFMASTGIEETADEKRLRHVACLLGDIAWRAHPDYRGQQSLDVISHANLLGVDHPGRNFVALAVYFRHVGLFEGELPSTVRELVTTRMIDRARILGGAMRVGYLLSAAMPNLLPTVPLVVRRGQLQLVLGETYATLGGERVANRLRQLARLIGREALIV